MSLLNRFKKGVMLITPIQMLRVEIVAYSGSIIGLIATGIISIFFLKMWWLNLTLGFFIILQIVGLISKIQEYNSLKQLEGENG